MFRGLDQDKYDRQYTDTYLFRRLGQFFQGQVRNLVILSLMGLLVSIVQALNPIIIAQGVGVLEEQEGTEPIFLLTGALLLTVLIQYFANWVRRALTSRLVSHMVARMRDTAFQAAVQRDMAFYDQNKTGKVLSRITNDTEEFGQILIVTSDVVSQLIQIFILGAVLFNHDVGLTLLILVFALPIVIVAVVVAMVVVVVATGRGYDRDRAHV